MHPLSNKRETLDILLQNLLENDFERLELNMENYKDRIEEKSINRLLLLMVLDCENNEQNQTFNNYINNM